MTGTPLPLSYAFTAEICRQIGPVHLGFAAACSGRAAPDPEASLRYLQLGCSTGGALLALAACHPASQFLGVDTDPAAIDLATEMACRAGLTNVSFRAGKAADLIAEGEADFDLVTLQGVWSAVDQPGRDAVLALLARRLAPGGLAYLSYKVFPGKTVLEPAYRVLTELTPADRPVLERVALGKVMLREMLDHPGPLLSAMPGFADAIQGILAEEDDYVAYEYLIGAWACFWASDVVRAFERAGLAYVGSALQPMLFDGAGIAAEQRARFDQLAGPAERELFRDLALNTNFRRDIFARAPRSADALTLLGGMALIVAPFAGPFRSSVAVAGGKISLSDGAGRLFAMLTATPRRIDEIMTTPGFDPNDLRSLIRSRQIVPARAAPPPTPAIGTLNRLMIEHANRIGEPAWLTSPILGGMVEVALDRLSAEDVAADLSRLGINLA